MKLAFPSPRQLLRRFRRDQSGTASVEFVLMLPLVMTVFASTFEIGLLMIKSSMLDRGVDVTMRALRLGHITLPDPDKLKTWICRESTILVDCPANISIELQRISTTTWSMPSSRVPCIDKVANISPPQVFVQGQENDVMLMRVCVAQEVLFPTAEFGLGMIGLGKQLPKSGAFYGLINVTAFVTEPD